MVRPSAMARLPFWEWRAPRRLSYVYPFCPSVLASLSQLCILTPCSNTAGTAPHRRMPTLPSTSSSMLSRINLAKPTRWTTIKHDTPPTSLTSLDSLSAYHLHHTFNLRQYYTTRRRSPSQSTRSAWYSLEYWVCHTSTSFHKRTNRLVSPLYSLYFD